MIHNQKVTVTTSPTDLLAGVDTDRPLEVHIWGGGNAVFLGDGAVTVNDGLPVSNLVLHMHGGTLYGVVASSTADLRVLALGM